MMTNWECNLRVWIPQTQWKRTLSHAHEYIWMADVKRPQTVFLWWSQVALAERTRHRTHSLSRRHGPVTPMQPTPTTQRRRSLLSQVCNPRDTTAIHTYRIQREKLLSQVYDPGLTAAPTTGSVSNPLGFLLKIFTFCRKKKFFGVTVAVFRRELLHFRYVRPMITLF